MLRITQNSAPAGAKSYYTTSDYYSEGQELAGQWRGRAASRLGLASHVERADWDALCDNLNPATGETLTARQKAERRVGYDFNFHVPKSVSILYALTRDERIVNAFRESVEATMEDIEREMQARVRTRGANSDRTTGNMVWGEFVHFTARPVDGVPDPHLHAHCFVFNTTWDAAESRWKAGQFAGLKRDAPFFEAVFHARLARWLEDLGLPVERTKRGWELTGIPRSALQKFSRRTALIEATAREKSVTDADAKGALGAKTRERKQKELTLDELRSEWKSRLSADELAAIGAVRDRVGGQSISEDGELACESVKHAISHCFERNSVVPERKLLTEAIKRSVGTASPERVTRIMASENLVVGDRAGRRMATTRDVLGEERRIIEFAKQGRGTCRKLGRESHEIRDPRLNEGQRRAVRHILESRDRVILLRGGAGTGKTTMMKEAVGGIEAGGTGVFTFAPSADASRGVLRTEGFDNADTVARLLKDEKMQAGLRGQVIWVDEAGLLGTHTTAQLFDIAERLGARVILSGDRRQHGSVERGATLRLLEEEAGLVPAELRDIQRQSGEYKRAVEALSEGRTKAGFGQLDRLGWVREVPQAERYKALANDYVASVKDGKTALVVTPTHLEGERVTQEIRHELKAAGRLGKDERVFATLGNANLTEAERGDSVNYLPGDVLVFHQNAKGHRKGERIGAGDGRLPLDQAARFQVFHSGQFSIAAGDVIRITRNGTTADGEHRLNNGALYRVLGFTADGDIRIDNNWTIARDYGFLAHGYVVTSHASQGKSVDRVFIAQSAQSFPASSREQFYVSVSRGREQATIYTDDKDALLDAVSQSDDRLTATELVGNRDVRAKTAALVRRAELERTHRESQVAHRERELERAEA